METGLRPQACNFIKKETLVQVLSCKFCEISKNAFLTEHLWATASVIQVKTFVIHYFFLQWLYVVY